MKHAIIMTGQLRTWKFLKPIIENLKKNYDIDFFLSIDLCNKQQCEHKNSEDETNSNELNEALDFYKPISYYSNNYYNESNFNKNINNLLYQYQSKIKINDQELLEKSFSNSNKLKFKALYKHFGILSTNKFDIRSIKLLSEQYFYVYKGYELLETHIKNNNVKYDSIIKLRFDQLIWNDNFYFNCNNVLPIDNNKEQLVSILKNTQLKLDIPESNEICVFGGGVLENYGYVNDQFWCHHTDIIHIMRDFYLNLPFIIQDSFNTFWPCYGGWIEHFFAKYLFKNNLIIKRSILNGIFIREFA